MTKKELMAKLEVLEDNGVVSEIFLQTIGLDNLDSCWVIVGNRKKVKCLRNYYYDVGVPEIIQSYIDKGYMKRAKEDEDYHDDYLCFIVTEEGFAWLSKLLGIKVEEAE